MTSQQQQDEEESRCAFAVAKDGQRRIAYAEYGDLSGTPVFHCHGSGGSRLERPPGGDEMLKSLGVRFVSIDRPGHGRSDPHPERTLLGFADDVAAVADALEIDRFFVEGWSAGGAYALATAYKLKERVIAGAILSGIGPYDRPDPYRGMATMIKLWMFFARRNSSLVYPFRKLMASQLSSKSAPEIGAMLAPSDSKARDERAVASSPDAQLVMGQNIKEGYRQGHEGPSVDDFVVNNPWGFGLADIETRIHVWQGAIDSNVPIGSGIHQDSLLPNSDLTILEETAHLFPLVRWREILLDLIDTETK